MDGRANALMVVVACMMCIYVFGDRQTDEKGGEIRSDKGKIKCFSK